MAHSYVYVGEREAGIEAARVYAHKALGLAADNNADLIVFRYGLFSVEDARKVIHLAGQAAMGDQKLIVIAPERIFHEAQNALLKLFEEPPVGTTLVLVIPTRGILLPTLRSRLLSLQRDEAEISREAKEFINASTTEREKLVAKLLDRAKSDKDEEKQSARGEALRLAEGLMQSTYASLRAKESDDLRAFANDLDHFIPILHERSAPLKPLFEHLLIVVPKLEKVL